MQFMKYEGDGVFGPPDGSPEPLTIVGGDVMPNGDGGWMPIPPVLTKAEAILYLRLDDAPNPERSLRYYREHGLKAVQVGKELRYTQKALNDFLDGSLK